VKPLDRLVEEARNDLVPNDARDGDAQRWKAVEDRVVERMAQMPGERAQLVAEVNGSTRRAQLYRIGAVVLAAAAAIAMVVRNESGGLLVDPAVSAQADLTAGSLRGTEGAGEVRVDGEPAAAGHVLRAGDVIDVDGTRALLERPRKVAWLLEREASTPSTHARAHVKSAGETLILGLEEGVVEAQVTPVPAGEAFAIDIATDKALVRVAVHGTHLRVARMGTRVVVDLTEGVVSIGAPPRTGSTYGTLVTAPSHVEFDAANLGATLIVDHAAAAVRAPIALGSREAPVAARNEGLVPAAGSPALPVVMATVPRPSTAPIVRAVDPARSEPAKVEPGKPAVPAREAIAAAVRECAAARRRPENVRVTVTSSLKLKVAPTGDIETAQFDPPLLPEIQTCAAATIYKAKLEDATGGSVTIPIDFSY
jgi:hypothetical protein